MQFFEWLKTMLSFDFIVRALIVGCLVSLCCALLGVNLVLKRYSMIGDGLSHVGFAALTVAAVCNLAPLAVAIPAVILAAFLLLRLGANSKLKGDAATAIVCSSALAIGVMITSVSDGMNAELTSYMFGSILAMSSEDVILSVILSILVLVLFVLFYNRIFAVTFDETFAKATGVKTGIFNMLSAFLTAITIVLGMRLMGTLLISSLIIFPALTAMRVYKKFFSVILCSAVLSVVCFFIGIALSFAFALPAGASVVLINLAMFLLFSVIGKIKYR